MAANEPSCLAYELARDEAGGEEAENEDGLLGTGYTELGALVITGIADDVPGVVHDDGGVSGGGGEGGEVDKRDGEAQGGGGDDREEEEQEGRAGIRRIGSRR